MNRLKKSACVAGMIVAGFAFSMIGLASPPEEPAGAASQLPSLAEARTRAKLLHGTIHDTLQIVHSRYYREDEGLPIPAATLKLVFQEMSERDGVDARWLVVNAKAMNVDHKPRDDFEKKAAQALADGEDEYELAAEGVYRRVGKVDLGADCLSCHMSARSSNKSRLAGLALTIPIARP